MTYYGCKFVLNLQVRMKIVNFINIHLQEILIIIYENNNGCRNLNFIRFFFNLFSG